MYGAKMTEKRFDQAYSGQMGSFKQALAKAYLLADSTNQGLIAQHWPELMNQKYRVARMDFGTKSVDSDSEAELVEGYEDFCEWIVPWVEY